MKQLIFSILILSASCQKQEVDCDQMRSKCTYIQFSFSDCTPNGTEIGWDYDYIYSDTSTFEVTGCPEMIESDFANRLKTSTNVHESLVKFNQLYPSTCNCE